MTRILAAIVVILSTSPVGAAGVRGTYIEARTCDIWTGACFANAEMGLAGKHAILAWKVEQGVLDGVTLDGLGIVAVVEARNTLGLKQTGPARSLLIIDERATPAQRAALMRLARQQAGELVRNVVAVESAPVDLSLCPCKTNVCARLEAGPARMETRCIDHRNDKACGHEQNFYPPLARDVTVRAAIAVEHAFTGSSFNETWTEADRRGAYVGSFAIR